MTHSTHLKLTDIYNNKSLLIQIDDIASMRQYYRGSTPITHIYLKSNPLKETTKYSGRHSFNGWQEPWEKETMLANHVVRETTDEIAQLLI